MGYTHESRKSRVIDFDLFLAPFLWHLRTRKQRSEQPTTTKNNDRIDPQFSQLGLELGVNVNEEYRIQNTLHSSKWISLHLNHYKVFQSYNTQIITWIIVKSLFHPWIVKGRKEIQLIERWASAFEPLCAYFMSCFRSFVLLPNWQLTHHHSFTK